MSSRWFSIDIKERFGTLNGLLKHVCRIKTEDFMLLTEMNDKLVRFKDSNKKKAVFELVALK